jgi:hypothetical protein
MHSLEATNLYPTLHHFPLSCAQKLDYHFIPLLEAGASTELT